MPRVIAPATLGKPLGMYSHGMTARAGEIVVVAGQVGTDATGRVAGPDVGAQTRQALDNIGAVLAAAGCGWKDVVRLQTFLTSAEDIDGFMAARKDVFPTLFPGGAYPPNTLLVVSRLVRPELRVEIEAMAVKSSPPSPDGRGAARGKVAQRVPAARGRARAGAVSRKKGR